MTDTSTPATPAAPDAAPSDQAPVEPENKFVALRERLAGPMPTEDPADEGGDDPEAGAAADGDGQDDAGDGDEGGKDEKPEPPPKFRVLGEDGEPVELTLPEGASITFKAGGAEQKVTSLADLVDLAQKGVGFDRAMNEVGEQRKAVKVEREAMNREREDWAVERQQLADNFDELLLSAVFDETAREKMAEALADMADPEQYKLMRENARLKAEAEKRATAEKAKDTETAQQTEQQQVAALHEGIQQVFTESLGDYPALEADDLPLVLTMFGQAYQQNLEQITDALRQQGIEGDALAKAADEQGRAFVTVPNLKAVMERLNARLGTGRAPAKPEARATDGAKAKAAAHNNRTDQKLRQRDRNRVLRGGGAPPAAGGSSLPDLPENATWEQRRERMSRLLDTARRPST